jgi:hypothetical protein
MHLYIKNLKIHINLLLSKMYALTIHIQIVFGNFIYKNQRNLIIKKKNVLVCFILKSIVS